ncbi:MAG TPA: hypothetical protein VH500_14610 [Nitrososphaeraceae archaeon]|jgi:hypothetical protein
MVFQIISGDFVRMNIAEFEQPVRIIAKTCGSRTKGRKIAYFFIDLPHSLCIDKKEIIYYELEACESLSGHTTDEADRKAIEIEIEELKMALDLIH